MHSTVNSIFIQDFIESNYNIRFYETLIDKLKYFESSNSKGVLHPLGFIIITLSDWNDGERVRLHIWPEGERTYNNNQSWIHNHEYSVKSLVITGTLLNRKFELLENAQSNPYSIYKVSYNNNNSDLFLTDDRCDIRLVESEELESGGFYTVSKWEFHMVDIPQNQVTCTLVLNYERGEGTGYVIGLSDSARPYFPFTRNTYDKDKLKILILNLLHQLEKNVLALKN